MRRRTFIGGAIGLFSAASVGVCARGGDGPPSRRLTLDGELSISALPAGEPATTWAILKVGTTPSASERRAPIDVGLVIDTSSSMEGKAIAAARQAAAELVATLRDGDRLSIVTFDSRARLVVPAVEIDDDTRDEALEEIDEIEARGTTDLAAGLQMVVDDLEPRVAGGRVTRIVLLSDGVPNDPSTIPWAVSRAASLGITITALGLGLEYDEVLLEQLARDTGGSFTFLEDLDAIGPTFAEQTRRLQGVLAKDLQLTVVPGPKCQLLQVDGVAVAPSQRSWGIPLGDLAEGEERVIAVQLSVAPHRDGTTAELLDATLTFTDPMTAAAGDPYVTFLSSPVTADHAVLAQAALPGVEREVERARAAASTLRALEASRSGNGAAAQAILHDALPQAAASADRFADDNLDEQIKNMTALAEELESAEEDAPAPSTTRILAPPRARASKTARRAHSAAVSNFQTRRAER